MDINEYLLGFLDTEPISDIGVTSLMDFPVSDYEKKAIEGLSGYVNNDINKRQYPRLTMEACNSIISVAMPYTFEEIKMPKGLRVSISQGAIGIDYHITLKEVLNRIAKGLSNDFNGKAMVFTDTGPLSDRAVALASNIGYIGKNTSLVSKNGGSGVFLGYILTDLKIKPTNYNIGSCGSCNRCVKYCPTSALDNGFDYKKCISYITQKKGTLSPLEIKLMGDNIYGCHICHRVCPKTKAILPTFNRELSYPLARDILELNKNTFKDSFGNTAMSFRGVNHIRRNVIYALYNINTSEAIDLIALYKNDNSSIVADTVEYVLRLIKENK